MVMTTFIQLHGTPKCFALASFTHSLMFMHQRGIAAMQGPSGPIGSKKVQCLTQGFFFFLSLSFILFNFFVISTHSQVWRFDFGKCWSMTN